ncbi:MucR family transcriptional regulator [Oryzicola mucosus]|uniref:MucR family transcriptional regulator n=1 Tax=Oryzicola mucosus TaxID=2767425 RepID=A0A8J6U1X5_9HYPH|nr:MucR family transcriptional regulator [Oryzicola mucosus]MBD0415033.1 MucR family transcriptional regulator [Oryzicola mucosus]
MSAESKADILELTAHIVSAYVEKNQLPASALPELIASVNASIAALSSPAETPVEPLVPAVNPKKSIQNDHIVCLEDGKKFKSLKRHLAVHYGLTPEAYRTKWGLPKDYPMVAPSYAARRSELAKQLGLGKASVAEPEPEPAPKKTRAAKAK